MSNRNKTIWDFLFQGSPHNAANPDPYAQSNTNNSSPSGQQGKLIEEFVEFESVAGMHLNYGRKESGFIGPHGQLLRSKENISLIIGCGCKIDADKNSGKKIAGVCQFCKEENLKELQKGKITLFNAERLSLVCTDCARRSASGLLCCPRHATRVQTEEGEIYADPQQLEDIERKNTIQKIISPFIQLFTEDGSDEK